MMTREKQEELFVDYEQVSYKQETERFLKELPHYTQEYVVGLFPIASWIRRYNLLWMVRDLIAGITVGIVVVPQSMAYAKIAMLPPQYGLYTAFVGLCVYCLFATSKDISIGPTAVMSLLVGQTITRITAESSTITATEIAVAFSLLTGAIAMFLGLVRLGILVDFIPACSIAGFMTGSAITITIGQWPKLFGIKNINTQDSTYLIFGNFFKNLPNTKIDVAFGLVSLVWLYGVRYGCQYLSKRYPKYSTHLFFFSIMRNGILVIVGTLIAFLINIGKTTSPISILKTVPAGFQAMGVPRIDGDVVSSIASSLPSGVIILILEHVAIAKSFGRINNYTINPDQEIIAIGFTNIWASFFGAYPSTGSFSRTAIKARSGVKTPIAGIFSALVVVLALYALTPAFYYIPDAVLSAVVIHAVADLVSGPSYIKRLASVSLWELFVFVVTVIVTFFTTVEYGIYASVALSIVILLFRIARPRFWALGRVPLASDLPKAADDKSCTSSQQRYLYVPQNHPSLGKLVEPLPSGVLMCRVDESFTYPNSGYISDKIIAYCKENTRRGGAILTKGDRAWNDDANPEVEAAREQLPLLHALILDVAGVNRLDSSGLQAVVDAQAALNRFAGHHVEFHFVNIVHPAIRRALIVAGFGTQPIPGREGQEILPVVPASKDGPQPQRQQQQQEEIEQRPRDLEEQNYSSGDDDEKPQQIESAPSFHSKAESTTTLSNPIPLPKDVYPFFHWSADDAVNAAVRTLSVRLSLQQQVDQ
ncbi:sulfate transporter family-domain-containing protein [Halteromyces radiatus]|uniref:sulfate transporter family-domain-containing protein n=1 Tax=Halteromyces radiatus TaxID=101107 RepID=UPI00221F8725|nr:sulfate transporter family-domain-containing protein [Halteromyces radiatus]KAI8086065.1 sulfate transporter family-domain-containing protein [Halteromyces radiatus]